jgi:CRP/FNR family transcriptional regulator, dissimilatory nitrate respiration regulator
LGTTASHDGAALTPSAPSTRALLSAIPLFGALHRSTLERLAQATTRRSVARGGILFRQGDLLTCMYVLVYGEIRLMARGARGQRLAGVVRPGSSFGEPMLFLERPAVVSAEAATDALVLQVPKQAVFDELERSPLFVRQLVGSLCRRIESLVGEAERHALPGGRARLIEYLARNAQPDAGSALVQLPGPKASVASHLHLSPESFSRVLHGLAAEGLIEVRARRIRIPDLERLLADVPQAGRAPGRPQRARLPSRSPAKPAS